MKYIKAILITVIAIGTISMTGCARNTTNNGYNGAGNNYQADNNGNMSDYQADGIMR